MNSLVFLQHGESQFNVQKRLGGDSDLTVRGEEVCRFIPAFMNKNERPYCLPSKLQVIRDLAFSSISTCT